MCVGGGGEGGRKGMTVEYYFMIYLHESFVVGLGLGLGTAGSQVRSSADCSSAVGS